MKIRPDWISYLHNIRGREMAAAFGRCPPKAFNRVLELGAGDGFVSTIIAEYAGELVSTDLNPQRLEKEDFGHVTYRICDAEEVGDIFGENEFDMVFSSSLLEHLPDCERALRGIHRVMADDGITIHFMPNRYWKLVTVLLYIPHRITRLLDKIITGRIFRRRKGHKLFKPYKQQYRGNNLKTGRRRRFFLAKLFLPKIHGVSSNTIAEFAAFGRARWLEKFRECGFEVLAVKKIGFNSGYGFGCDRLRKLMEKMSIHTCYAYIAHKMGCQCSYGEYFRQ